MPRAMVDKQNPLQPRPGRGFLHRTAIVYRIAIILALLTLLFSPLPDVNAQQAACPTNRIHGIQGPGHLSPCASMTVQNVVGIVTAVISSGFYLQDPQPDTPPPTGADFSANTSEGIFVYTTSSGPKPEVSDSVRVMSGTVLEFRDINFPDALTITEIASTDFFVESSGNSLPAPFIIGAGGTPVSDRVIDDDPEPNVETGGVFDPAPSHDAIDLYESLEGMRVQINDPLTSAGTDADGQLVVIPDGGVGYSERIAGRGQILRPDDPNPERIYLDNSFASISIPNVWSGSRFAGPAVGVMHYASNNFRIVLTQALPANPNPGAGEPVDTVLPAPPARLTAATYNVANLAGTSPLARFDLLAAQIVTSLAAPDLLVLEGIHDDNGLLSDGTVSAGLTLSQLTAAIQTAGGPAYAWMQINPLNNQDGGAPVANTRQVILYNPARLLAAQAPPGDAVTPVALTPSGPPHLTLNPGRINPTHSSFQASHKPLAAEFAFQGRMLFVIACHLNSKIGDQPLFGPNQPPLLSTEEKRIGQSGEINTFVRALLDRDPQALILVLGDMNEHDWAKPLETLKTGGDSTVELYNLAAALPHGEQHYSFIYEGNAQAIDHIFASPAWLNAGAVDPALVSFDDVHINAERWATDPMRASDHDPVWASLDLPAVIPEVKRYLYLPTILR